MHAHVEQITYRWRFDTGEHRANSLRWKELHCQLYVAQYNVKDYRKNHQIRP